jgi:RNA polymerase sigma-70 factor (ECF subfamily)
VTDADLHALRRGDEAAFRAFVRSQHSSMVRLARMYVDDSAIAEEVVQETWVAVLRGLESFEGRSSLRTWIHRILVNVARRYSGLEFRSIPFSSVAIAGEDDRAVDADRFQDDGPYAGHWLNLPEDWSALPQERLLSKEVRQVVQEAVDELPPAQREVIVLRDVHGWSSDEVCEQLHLTPGNQRVLLHRARARVRRRLEEYLAPATLPG